MTMRSTAVLVGLFLGLAASSLVAGADWNVLNYFASLKNDAADVDRRRLDYNVLSYCEAWRINVEVHNIRGFDVVPGECVEYVGKYMESAQFKVDVQLAAEEAVLFLSHEFHFPGDGTDAWVFDIDDVLLSTVPFYKNHFYGGVVTDKANLKEWMKKGEAPAVKHMVNLFHAIRSRGLKIIIISSRPEYLRKVTVQNLVEVGYHGWSELIFKNPDNNYPNEEEYKASEKKKLQEEKGYRYWGIMGSQYNSIGGYTSANRIFKLPNPMYYIY